MKYNFVVFIHDKQMLQTSPAVVHGAMGCGQKINVAVPPAPVRVPSQRPLAPSVTSVTSVS